jgi:hypothetical protein
MKFAILTLALLFVVPAYAEEVLHASDYYPLTVGTTWTMELVGPQGNTELINTIEGVDKINEKELIRLTGSINGTVIATEHLEITDRGITRNQFNGAPITPPIVLLPEPIELGKTITEKEVKMGSETMSVKIEVGDKLEKVKSPAGEFEAVHVKVTAKPAGGQVISDYWFAKGVGIVKQELKLGEVSVTTQLKSYEIAKDTPKPGPKKESQSD